MCSDRQLNIFTASLCNGIPGDVKLLKTHTYLARDAVIKVPREHGV